MKKIIHVKQANINYNSYYGVAKKPVFVIKTENSQQYGHSVEIKGPSKLVYDPLGKAKCGSRVWLETEAEVEISWERGMAEEGV